MTAAMSDGFRGEPSGEDPLQQAGPAGLVGDAARSEAVPPGDGRGLRGQASAPSREDPGDLHRMTLRLLLRV
jgi:hypothetical protein